MNSDNNTAETLNSIVTVRIAPSKIHGVGIFALRDMPAGKKMFLYGVPRV